LHGILVPCRNRTPMFAAIDSYTLIKFS
jgi:hypothetical protein